MDGLAKLFEVNKYYVVCSLGSLLVGFGACWAYLGMDFEQEEDEQTDFDVETVEEEPVCEVFVDISGAIANPGVYCLPADSIVGDLIEEAGGFRENICTLWVDKQLNRAQLVESNAKIYVPTTEDSECGVKSEVEDVKSKVDGRISLNTGSQQELESLPGIGEAIATRIIEARPFSKLEDIKEVKGIGDKLYEKIKDKIVL